VADVLLELMEIVRRDIHRRKDSETESRPLWLDYQPGFAGLKTARLISFPMR
jgi:hypothetical protein